MLILGHKLTDGAPAGLDASDLLRHLYILGKTGSGKSTVLLRLLTAWMELGDGVAVVDPHGDLVTDMLKRIPPTRIRDVVVIDPADRVRPIAWNPLYRIEPERRPVVAQGLIGAFKGVWRDSWGPRMEYILMNGLRLLLDAETESLLGLQRLLVDKAYRRHLERMCLDSVVARFWRLEFDTWDERFRREAVAPIQNKIGQFLSDPLMRGILGQRKSKLDLRVSMDRGRILLVNLSKGLVGESTANLFGSLFVASLHEAALSRANLPEAERRPFLLAVDEFQNVATDRFASTLSEARKYGLGLVLSHQFLDQLLPEIRSAVLGNAGSMLLFRMGGMDAGVFAEEFGKEWPASRFADLPSYEAVFSASIRNGMPVAKAIKTLGPELGSHDEIAILTMIARSSGRFGSDREEVVRKIDSWLRRAF